jgi:DNA-binding IclR family transcriptional regulator
MEDEAMHAVLRGTTSWLSEAGATTRLDIAKTIADVAAVRRRGFALAPDRTRRSLQVLAYPLEREPLALAVSLPSSLPPSEVAAVRGAIECRLAPPETEIVMQPAAMLAKMQKGSKERLLF